jgi:hypothetical protein
MAENKTKPTAADVRKFLESIENPVRKQDCFRLAELMEEITGTAPRMWGSSIVGFGDYHYKYASGREGDWFLCGFSPRKQSLTIYVMGYLEFYGDLLVKLGKFKHGKGCLYINKLEDVDMRVLRRLIVTSIDRLEKEASS